MMKPEKVISVMEKKLISLVKEHEFLYNRKATYYKDLARKEEKWTEIAAELNIEVKKAKQRWKSLRDRFAREYGKVRSSGCETQEVTWKYFNALSFLKDCTEPRENMIKNEIKTDLNPKNINELFSTFLSENEESGQGISGTRIQENGHFQKGLPLLFKIERNVECTIEDQQQQQHHQHPGHHHQQQQRYLNNSTIPTGIENDEFSVVNNNRSQQNAFQKEPILISFDNTALTAKANPDTKQLQDPNRYVQTAQISTIHAVPQQNETFIRSFFNAMAIQVEQANLNFQSWATIQTEVMEVVNRNIIQSIHQQNNRFCTNATQTQPSANGNS